MGDAEPTREVRHGERVPVGQGHYKRARELGIAARWMRGKQPAARRDVDLEIRLGPRVDAREARQEIGRCEHKHGHQPEGDEAKCESLAYGQAWSPVMPAHNRLSSLAMPVHVRSLNAGKPRGHL